MKQLKRIAASLIAVAAIIAVGFAQPTLARDFTLATSTHPEHFTELYFNNLLSLPPVIDKGKPENLSFTIANHEGSSTTYHYRVSIVENGHLKSTVASVTLSPEQTAHLPVHFVAAKAGETIEIIVELPDQNQSVHFRSHS